MDRPDLSSLPEPAAQLPRHPASDSSARDDGTGKGKGRPRQFPLSRNCHDCGRATSDYRCEPCRRKWRATHEVTVEEGGVYDFGGVIV